MEFIDAKVAEDFYRFTQAGDHDVSVRVFLCGAALDETRTLEEQVDTNLRARIAVELGKLPGCKVTLAEHKRLAAAYDQATNQGDSEKNLTEFEMTLSRWAHVIIILPCSAGSLAELGLFTVMPKLGPKLLIFVDPCHGTTSYVWNGPIKAARKRNSEIVVLPYTDVQAIVERAVNRVITERSIQRSDKLLEG